VPQVKSKDGGMELLFKQSLGLHAALFLDLVIDKSMLYSLCVCVSLDPLLRLCQGSCQ
jgi:hypothetical protein